MTHAVQTRWRRPRNEAPKVVPAQMSVSLSDELSRRRLETRILAHMPAGRLALVITDNRFTMLAVNRDVTGPVYRVRLHHMFLDAPPHITRALAQYVVRNEPGASRTIGGYIEANQHRIRRASPMWPGRTSVPVEPKGEIFDLQSVFDDLNRRYFGARIEARITWGSRVRRPKRRASIKMGSYSVEERLIRIHPSLDRFFVPRYFLEWIVYHEMLHQVHAMPIIRGRRQFHTPQFILDERNFEHYERARQWERNNLDRLLLY